MIFVSLVSLFVYYSMITIAKEQLAKYILKAGVKDSIEDWLKKHNITIKVANGEEPI